jgi:hypothetical protein
LPDLIIEFDCVDAEVRAEEFQHHLLEHKLVPTGVQKETHENEIWLKYPGLQVDAIKRVTQEAHPWCLDRGLGLLQNTSEAPNMTLMIADLTRVVE